MRFAKEIDLYSDLVGLKRLAVIFEYSVRDNINCVDTGFGGRRPLLYRAYAEKLAKRALDMTVDPRLGSCSRPRCAPCSETMLQLPPMARSDS